MNLKFSNRKKRITVGSFFSLFMLVLLSAQIDVTNPPYNAIVNDGLDDGPAIRAAFAQGVDVYFPAGQYDLCSSNPEDITNILELNHKNNNSIITWHKDAELVVCPNFSGDHIPMSILMIQYQPNHNIENIILESPSVNGSFAYVKLGGITVQDAWANLQTTISGIVISNATVRNCTGSGITSWGAKQVTINNAYTEGNTYQGIGVLDIKDDGEAVELNIYGHESVNDAQSVDWSGPTIEIVPYTYIPNPDYSGIGVATDLISTSSKSGIKIAGFWDLDISNVSISDSEGNGFWCNFDFPGIEVSLSGINIKNCNNTGISLLEGNFNIQDLTLEKNTCNFRSVGSNLIIDALEIIDATADFGCAMRIIGQDVQISNFNIEDPNSTASGGYSFQFTGNGTFENGSISAPQRGVLINNISPTESAHTCWNNVLFNQLSYGLITNGANQEHYLENCKFENNTQDILCAGTGCAANTFIVNNTTITPSVGEIDLNDLIDLVIDGNYVNIYNPTPLCLKLYNDIGNIVYVSCKAYNQLCLESGDYLLTVEVPNGCLADIPFTINEEDTSKYCKDMETIGRLSNNASEDERYQIYPNPVANIFQIQGDQIAEIQIYDVTGQQISANVHRISEDVFQVETTTERSGILFVKIITTKGKVYSKKIVRLD